MAKAAGTGVIDGNSPAGNPKVWATQKEADQEAEIKDLRRQLAQAQAVIDKLPKTADGMPVVRGDTLYVYCRRAGLYRPREGRRAWDCKVRDIRHDENHGWKLRVYVSGSHMEWFWATDCYSTREAAEAAKKDGRSAQ